MKIAAAAYPLDALDSWAAYEDKIAAWIGEAAGQGADLLVFPEYGAMELAALAGRDVARDVEASIFAVSERMEDAVDLHARLAREHGVHVLMGSGPALGAAERPVNRAHLVAPSGAVGHQDKQILVPWERSPLRLSPGDPLRLFDTALGRIGVLICYDGEFPLLGRALSEADILLVPSCTEAVAGYWRVRVGAMARALENQCVSVMSSVVGLADWSDVVDVSHGAGGIFAPPDTGFPETGVLAAGVLDAPGWTYAEFDLEAVTHVRTAGAVANRSHWIEQDVRAREPEKTVLR